MKKMMTKLAALGAFCSISGALMAEGDVDTSTSAGLAKIAAGFAMALGAFGAATGQGRAAASALEGLARNPSSKDQLFVPLLLSLVFMEFQALLCFVIAQKLAG